MHHLVDFISKYIYFKIMYDLADFNWYRRRKLLEAIFKYAQNSYDNEE